MAKTWQCQWGLVVILHQASFTHTVWELKRGLYLMCQLFMVVHPGNHNQLPPPAGCFICPSPPGHPLLQLFYWRFREGIFVFSSSELLTGPQRKQSTSGFNSGGSSKSNSSQPSLSSSNSETLWERWYPK